MLVPVTEHRGNIVRRPQIEQLDRSSRPEINWPKIRDSNLVAELVNDPFQRSCRKPATTGVEHEAFLRILIELRTRPIEIVGDRAGRFGSEWHCSSRTRPARAKNSVADEDLHILDEELGELPDAKATVSEDCKNREIATSQRLRFRVGDQSGQAVQRLAIEEAFRSRRRLPADPGVLGGAARRRLRYDR